MNHSVPKVEELNRLPLKGCTTTVYQGPHGISLRPRVTELDLTPHHLVGAAESLNTVTHSSTQSDVLPVSSVILPDQKTL